MSTVKTEAEIQNAIKLIDSCRIAAIEAFNVPNVASALLALSVLRWILGERTSFGDMVETLSDNNRSVSR